MDLKQLKEDRKKGVLICNATWEKLIEYASSMEAQYQIKAVQHDSDCSINNRGVPELLGPCDCSMVEEAPSAPAELGFPSLEEFAARSRPPKGYEDCSVISRNDQLIWLRDEDRLPTDLICFYDGDCRDVLTPYDSRVQPAMRMVPAELADTDLPPLPKPDRMIWLEHGKIEVPAYFEGTMLKYVATDRAQRGVVYKADMMVDPMSLPPWSQVAYHNPKQPQQSANEYAADYRVAYSNAVSGEGKPQQHTQAALSDSEIKLISDGLQVADVLIDMIPTRLQNHADDTIARIGELVNVKGGYKAIALAKRCFSQCTIIQSSPRIITKENAKEFLEETLWDFIETSGNFPDIKTDPRTWEHVMVYAPIAITPAQTGMPAVEGNNNYEPLFTCIDEALENYVRHGSICDFEGQPMIYASTLLEIANLLGEVAPHKRPDSERDAALTKAASDVLGERKRQVEKEGWELECDDQYRDYELAQAAACYAYPALAYTHHKWPWAAHFWKPTTDRRNLIKAGALILAEIERLDRAAMSAQQGEKGGA